MQTLSNHTVSIAIDDHGAELASLRHNGREYLWQADPAFWRRRSPVLFPFVGSVWQGQYRAKGQTYSMGQHGFARDMDFELMRKTDDEIWYRLTSDSQTHERYPYDFVLEIGYRLADKRVTVMWRVTNIGCEALPFQIGAHPAFYWPMLTDAQIDGGVQTMERPLLDTDKRGFFRLDMAESLSDVPVSVVTEGGCIGATSSVAVQDGGYLPLDVHTFDHDALVIEDGLVRGVTLCDDERRPYLTMTFDSPLVGLWSPPGRRAPFVCIEPWYGRADAVAFADDITRKPWINILEPDQVFDAHYDIIIH